MPFEKNNPFRIKPKYSDDDLEAIKQDLIAKVPIEEMLQHIKARKPEISPVTAWRWIEKVMKEIGDNQD